MEFPEKGDPSAFDLPYYIVPDSMHFSASAASSDSIYAVPPSYNPEFFSGNGTFERPADSVREILRQYKEESTDSLFDHLTQKAFSYRIPTSSVPPLDRSEGTLVCNDPELQGKKEQWGILGRVRELCNTQSKVSSQRHVLRLRAAELRTKRDNTAELGTELLDKLRLLTLKFSAQPAPPELIGSVFESVENLERFQQIFDEYQERETSYREDEKRLDKEEFRLEEAEGGLQTELQQVGPHQLHQLNLLFGEYHESEKHPNNPDEVHDVQHGYHPLVHEYLSLEGESEDLQETLWEIYDERASLLEQQAKRRQYGLELGREELEDLEDINQKEKELLDTFARIQEDMERLKLECDRQGLDVDAPPASPPDTSGPESEPSAPSFNASTNGLLDPWREKRPTYFEGIPEMPDLQSRINGAQFMNKWLLDQLCLSSFQVLLRKTLVKEFPVVEVEDEEDEKQFRDSVLDAWSSDTAIDSMLAIDTGDKASRQPVDLSDAENSGQDADPQNVQSASDAEPEECSPRASEDSYSSDPPLSQVPHAHISDIGRVNGRHSTPTPGGIVNEFGDSKDDVGEHTPGTPTVMDQSTQTVPESTGVSHYKTTQEFPSYRMSEEDIPTTTSLRNGPRAPKISWPRVHIFSLYRSQKRHNKGRKSVSDSWSPLCA